MKEIDITIITCFIDLFIFYILITQKLTNYELIILLFAIVIHLILICSIYLKKQKIIDYLHIIYVIYIYILSLFVTNNVLVFLFLLIFIMMLYYWHFENKCPMGEYETIEHLHNIINSDIGILFTRLVTLFVIFILIKKLF